MRGGVATATEKHTMATGIFSVALNLRWEAYQCDDGGSSTGKSHDVEMVGKVELWVRESSE